MRLKLTSIALGGLALARLSQSKPITSEDQLVLSSKTPRPLVLWHGLGDTALSEGISEFIERIKEIHPGIFVHSVQIPQDGSPDDERKAGFWGNAEDQGKEGCEQIKAISELEDGFDALGFSQGGLFLRYYAQYCNGPPIRNLVTFGSPHYGISALIPCPTPPTLSCLLAARAARGGIYTPWAQEHLVQAAYFRDPERLDEFYEANSFIRDLNGEKVFAGDGGEGVEEDGVVAGKGRRGSGKGLAGLENFVAIVFDDDHTVSPAQSSHFATYSSTNKTEIISMYQQPLYTEDWIGLRALDETGGLRLEHCPGEHMDIGGEKGCGERMVKKWVGWV